MNILQKSSRKDPIGVRKRLYSGRNVVECVFYKIKHDRRIATHDDMTAENFLAALELVAVCIWLCGNVFTSKSE